MLQTYPYPSEAELEKSLVSKISWEETKKETLDNFIKEQRIMNADANDCRALLAVK